MKRASDDSSGGDAKKANTGTGGALKGMPGNSDDKVNPIPRPLKLQEITLHFTQRSWEEIGPGELKYLPLCQTPYYMFDAAMLEQLKKFKNIWATAYYHTPNARISNLIMLQDDLINQGGTPMETTAFTQACYMLKYTPTRQTQYFQLGNVEDCKTGRWNPLIYNMSETKCGNDYSYLVPLTNYEDFEKLAIIPAKIDKYAGYEPGATITIRSSQIAYIGDTFISPTQTNGSLAEFSANMQPSDASRKILAPGIDSLKQVTWARNLDKISLHKYGDVVDIPIHTNLDGVPLINSVNNDFTNRETEIEDDKGNKYKLFTDFVWPSNNRPYYSRRDNLSNIGTFETVKKFQPLHHTFLTMPPIRKANGALLKQRCSFILEQSFSITFNAVESVWDNDTDKYMLNQVDGVQVRPVVYGNMISTKVDEGAICPSGKFTCTGDKCPYDNSFASAIRFWINSFKSGKNFFGFTNKSVGTEYKIDPPNKFTNTDFYSSEFKTAWAGWVAAITPGTTSYFCINHQQKAHIELSDDEGQIMEYESEDLGLQFTLIPSNLYLEATKEMGIECNPVFGDVCKQNTDYFGINRETTMFYM